VAYLRQEEKLFSHREVKAHDMLGRSQLEN